MKIILLVNFLLQCIAVDFHSCFIYSHAFFIRLE